jgi:hypothetical protein
MYVWAGSAVTENTRASYPIHYIDNARIPCVGPHPKNLILLCCDAFGVLPPVSRLTKEQAMYHFISGYTAKVCLYHFVSSRGLLAACCLMVCAALSLFLTSSLYTLGNNHLLRAARRPFLHMLSDPLRRIL